jgi:hypothetical protein
MSLFRGITDLQVALSFQQYDGGWDHRRVSSIDATGADGRLIVHSPNDPLKRGADYDEDRILYLMDWM